MSRVLYAIQGTGNGHLSRALDVVPLLRERVGHLDVLVSGPAAEVTLPFAVRYRCRGMGFVFGKKGGIDFWRTFRQASSAAFVREVRELPVQDYDLVISDFEPVSAWACRHHQRPCVALSHQAAVLHPAAPQPRQADPVGRVVLRHYAPATAHYGFHFAAYAPGIHTPVIRRQVRQLAPTDGGHYTVYLPAFGDAYLVEFLQRASRRVRWEVFAKHSRHAATYGNVQVRPVGGEAFTRSLASSAGVLCGAGFETPAEALYLGKKLLVVPMKQQLEQQCNAAALAALGVPVLRSLKSGRLPELTDWLAHGPVVPVSYPDETSAVLDRLLHEQLGS